LATATWLIVGAKAAALWFAVATVCQALDALAFSNLRKNANQSDGSGWPLRLCILSVATNAVVYAGVGAI
jgi:hypothetical protein